MASLMALQGFIHAVALGVASGKGGAAYNVAAILFLLKDDFEIHDAFDECILKRFWSWQHFQSVILDSSSLKLSAYAFHSKRSSHSSKSSGSCSIRSSNAPRLQPCFFSNEWIFSFTETRLTSSLIADILVFLGYNSLSIRS